MKPLLLVDGYNVIGAWNVPKQEGLSIDEARERLVHLIADYAGYSGEEVIVVGILAKCVSKLCHSEVS